MHTKAESITINELLTSYRVASVPLYQRSFAWQEDELDEFWTDLEGILLHAEQGFFLGSVVLISKDGRDVEIVDGQQRITTLSLALCALRDGCVQAGDTARAALLSDYLGKQDFGTLKTDPKLILNEENNGLYRKILDAGLTLVELEGLSTSRTTEVSNRRLAKAYLYLHEKLAAFTASYKAGDKLKEFFEALVHKIEVVRILSSDDLSAYTLFETLNDRGVELALADLLKNYIFMRSDSFLEEVKSAWTEVTAAVGKESLTQFIRHQWMSRNGLIRERDLYKKLKARITTARKAIEYLDEIKADAQLYSEIGNIHSSTWSAYGKISKEALTAVRVFGSKQCYPLILASHGLSSAQRDKVLDWMVTLLFRYSVIGEKGTGNLETLYARTSVEVRKTPYKQSEAKKLILGLYTSDADFIVSFGEKTLSKPELVKYVFARIENTRSGSPELTVDTDNLTVEHILPKNPVSGWGKKWQKGKPDHAANIRRIGNLTLLTGPMNDAVANDVISAKAAEYGKSKLSVTSDLGILSKWTETEIANRQDNLAKEAANIWKIQ